MELYQSNKKQLLAQVTQLAQQSILSEAELLAAYRTGVAGTDKDVEIVESHIKGSGLTERLSLAELLYYVGAFIVCLGIAIFIGQKWDVLNSTSRIGVTLGVSFALYVAAVLVDRYDTFKGVATAFHLISAIAAPVGLSVVFAEAGRDVGSMEIQSMLSGVLMVVYALSLVVFRQTIFTLFTIIFGTWFFFVFTNWLVGGAPLFDEWQFYEYRVLAVGLSYMALGYYLAQQKVRALTSWLYAVGVSGFLGAAFALGAGFPTKNVFWELIFPGLSLGVIFLSVYVKSRSFLIFGVLFLMAYILRITAEYFAYTVGWPLALVIAGLALIGVGYWAFRFNQRYLGQKRGSI